MRWDPLNQPKYWNDSLYVLSLVLIQRFLEDNGSHIFALLATKLKGRRWQNCLDYEMGREKSFELLFCPIARSDEKDALGFEQAVYIGAVTLPHFLGLVFAQTYCIVGAFVNTHIVFAD